MQGYGEKIKLLRREKGLTLKALAEMTGLSVGFLSKIEHCTTTPSYSTLQKLCFALDVSASAFEEDEGRDVPQDLPALLTRGDRALIYSYGDELRLERLFSRGDLFEITVMTLSGNDSRENVSRHHLNEFGIVISGTLCVTVNGTEYVAHRQEGILIPKETTHATRRLGDDDCVSVWIRYR